MFVALICCLSIDYFLFNKQLPIATYFLLGTMRPAIIQKANSRPQINIRRVATGALLMTIAMYLLFNASIPNTIAENDYTVVIPVAMRVVVIPSSRTNSISRLLASLRNASYVWIQTRFIWQVQMLCNLL